MNTGLPKWPRLLVTGKKISPEQAELVIVRTSYMTCGISCNDEKWNRTVARIFGAPDKWAQGPRGPYLATDHEAWERAAHEVGSLDVSYFYNDQIASPCAEGPHGWVDWNGRVFCDDGHLLSKWPEVVELDEDLGKIARAFPFLDMTVQLVRTDMDDTYENVIAYVPVLTWTVRNGGAELHMDAGDLIVTPARHDWDGVVRDERGVSEKRLRQAVERCRRYTRKGR